jgi:hypothetical protein
LQSACAPGAPLRADDNLFRILVNPFIVHEKTQQGTRSPRLFSSAHSIRTGEKAAFIIRLARRRTVVYNTGSGNFRIQLFSWAVRQVGNWKARTGNGPGARLPVPDFGRRPKEKICLR